MTATGTATAALEPARAHLLRTAAARAHRIRADARREAGRIRSQARAAAAAALDRARADGRADAAPLAAADLSRSRAAAAAALLRAQSQAYDELRRQVRAAVSALPAEPGYDRIAEPLARLAALAAGPGAVVTPVPAGGFVARSPGVVVDCSLDRLADLAVEALGADVAGLWAP